MSEPSNSRDRVLSRLEARRAELEAAKGRERVAVGIGLAALVFAIALVTMAADDVIPLHWAGALTIGTLGLVVSIAWREQRSIACRRLRHAVAFHEAARRRLDDDWDLGFDGGAAYEEASHPYAVDLDVIGAQSVFARMNTTATTLGRDALAALLLDHESRAQGPERQKAVRALADDWDLREALHVELAEFLAGVAAGPAAREILDARTRDLEGWGQEPPPPPEPTWHVARDLVLTAGFIGVLTMIVTGQWPWAVLLLSWGVNYMVLGGAKDVEEDLERFESVRGTLDGWARILRVIEDRVPSGSAPLDAVKADLTADDARASSAIADLDRRVERLAWRGNMFWAMTFDVALLWDLHARRALHRWKRRHGEHIDRWLRAAARVEAFAGLGNYAACVPDACWPEFVDDTVFEAEGLAHPLIAADVRGGNDLTLPDLGGVLLFTGSNMSGKSTFLRSIGLAVVFARAGLPVPANRLRLQDVDVATCMRISDDLAQGSSRFHAEVHRLAACVEAAGSQRTTLVLLDEILAGTNSEERHVGTDAVLRGLANARAVSLVATHDLGLKSLIDQLGDKGRLLHFRDDVTEGVMTFDYRLRDGACPSTNALRVMRDAGLDVPDDA